MNGPSGGLGPSESSDALRGINHIRSCRTKHSAKRSFQKNYLPVFAKFAKLAASSSLRNGFVSRDKSGVMPSLLA